MAVGRELLVGEMRVRVRVRMKSRVRELSGRIREWMELFSWGEGGSVGQTGNGVVRGVLLTARHD
jgi:hypothetical protein